MKPALNTQLRKKDHKTAQKRGVDGDSDKDNDMSMHSRAERFFWREGIFLKYMQHACNKRKKNWDELSSTDRKSFESFLEDAYDLKQ